MNRFVRVCLTAGLLAAVWFPCETVLAHGEHGGEAPLVLSVARVRAKAAELDVELETDLIDFQRILLLDADGDGEPTQTEMLRQRTPIEEYLNNHLWFLWDGHRHESTVYNVESPALQLDGDGEPLEPRKVIFHLRVPGYEPGVDVIFFSRFLMQLSHRATLLTSFELPGRLEVCAVSPHHYFSSGAALERRLAETTSASRRPARGERGRIVRGGGMCVEAFGAGDEGRVIVYSLMEDGVTYRPLPVEELRGQIKRQGQNTYEPLPLRADPAGADGAGGAYRFAAPLPAITDMQHFDLDLELPAKPPVRLVFNAPVLRPEAEKETWVCPVHLYDWSSTPGPCPQCEIERVRCGGETLDFHLPAPQHGGQVVATPDHWNFVEGVWGDDNTFRIHLLTMEGRPVVDVKLAGSVTLWTEGQRGTTQQTLPMGHAVGASLAAELPVDFAPPLRAKLKLDLHNEVGQQTMYFRFEKAVP